VDNNQRNCNDCNDNKNLKNKDQLKRNNNLEIADENDFDAIRDDKKRNDRNRKEDNKK
jgi:hypothetical protein